MNAKESSALVDCLFTLARTVGIGIPSYLLTEKLPDPNLQWASGALTVAAIVVSGKFQWRAGDQTTSKRSQRFGMQWSTDLHETKHGELTPLPGPFPSPAPEPADATKNLPSAKPDGADDKASGPKESKRKPSGNRQRSQKPERDRKRPKNGPPPPPNDPQPPGGSRGKRPK